MGEFNQSGQQESIQPIERPTAVTVLGIIGIVLGGLGILCTPISMIMARGSNSQIEMTQSYETWTNISLLIGIGFSVWFIITGIGLLLMSRWARRNAVIFAWIDIVWVVLGICINVAAFSLGWIKLPETMDPAVRAGMIGGLAGGICGGIVVGLTYPVLLLIFMRTEKIKQAFEVKEQTI